MDRPTVPKSHLRLKVLPAPRTRMPRLHPPTTPIAYRLIKHHCRLDPSRPLWAWTTTRTPRPCCLRSISTTLPCQSDRGQPRHPYRPSLDSRSLLCPMVPVLRNRTLGGGRSRRPKRLQRRSSLLPNRLRDLRFENRPSSPVAVSMARSTREEARLPATAGRAVRANLSRRFPKTRELEPRPRPRARA